MPIRAVDILQRAEGIRQSDRAAKKEKKDAEKKQKADRDKERKDIRAASIQFFESAGITAAVQDLAGRLPHSELRKNIYDNKFNDWYGHRLVWNHQTGFYEESDSLNVYIQVGCNRTFGRISDDIAIAGDIPNAHLHVNNECIPRTQLDEKLAQAIAHPVHTKEQKGDTGPLSGF